MNLPQCESFIAALIFTYQFDDECPHFVECRSAIADIPTSEIST